MHDLAQKTAEAEAHLGNTLCLPFEVKAASGDRKDRTFEGLSAVWDLDLGDDVIHRGAFAKSIGEWKGSKQEKKLLDSHSTLTIRAALGKLVDASEDKEGLWTKWKVIKGADGDAALDRIEEGVVDALSIGFKPIKFSFEENEKARFGVIRHLEVLDWKESSLVLFPMAEGALINPATVKSLIARGHYSPEELAELADLYTSLGEALKGAAPAPSDSLDEPDFSQLDALRVQRLRLMAR